MDTEIRYALSWCSAGCIPDSEWPQFIGTESECHEFMTADMEDPDGFAQSGGEWSTYGWSMDIWTDEDQAEFDRMNP